MKLEKAIEILELNIKIAGKRIPPDTLQALNLSIEALKYTQTNRLPYPLEPFQLLRGETPEPPPSDSLTASNN